VRIFRVPEINFDASNYMDIINWTKVDVTEPPLVAHFSPDDLQCIAKEGLGDKFSFPRLSCHTQAVERTVKLTEAASKVCGPEKRDGFIRTTLRSREKMPSLETKNDFQFKESLKSASFNSAHDWLVGWLVGWFIGWEGCGVGGTRFAATSPCSSG